MSAASARGKRSDPLSKKVPENPKFKHVRPTVDTGASISKHLEKLEELKRDYKIRKDELFKRMKITTFVQLVLQVADFDSHTVPEEQDDTNTTYRPDTADLEIQQIQGERGGGGGGTNGSLMTPSQGDTCRSRLEEVIRGVGEVDLNGGDASNAQRPVLTASNCPYLLLDIRDKDAYDECHIITAQNYPTAMLARSVNYETKDMLRYKNKEGKIIIVYDNDEVAAHRAATTLVERQYDNLFMLSGGLKVASRVFPEGLITGTVPASLIEGAGVKGRGAAPQAPVPATKTFFTQDDIDRLCIYIDSALSDNSSGSRLSQRPKGTGRMSTVSTLSSSTAMSGMGRKPFKP